MPTTLVALHYWAGAGHEFDALRALLPTVRLLSPDLPGFGQQPAPAGFDYSVQAYADWVAAYLRQHAVGQYTLLGHSMGGKIALAMAARRPPGLQRLLLLSPSPPTPEPFTDASRAAALAAFGHPAAAEQTFRNITQQPLSQVLHRQVVADNLCSQRPAWNAWLERGSREDISPLMPQLEVPCTVLVGAHDRAITPQTQRQQTLPWLPPGTPLGVQPHAGHLLPLEAPAAVAALVQAPA
ncbi:alpha/beta fold hydrolase [Hymenobacter arizonensis]|uniref:Pimeloyl-ACP methyl ester carboxylesterase n=1 Tax=Hymenobacter arizonensis TaxID=1227077 RepID=A0A1I6B5H3_HYMAR|nr:alpha/beta hydrolase [Hymenobacter arizonensis]SFQ76174.1 Pimeloyl-ACP methyl ester carboxylesterase [Hymenobacter arizonensis]